MKNSTDESICGGWRGVASVIQCDVRALGGCDMAGGGSEIEEDVAGSTSIGCSSNNGALNTSFGRFFKASIPLWIWAS
uniref:Uncharacterized protein n=1 Tax=Romanomermis culicivorax TaxID=13658 RepID=A0A915J7L7_ROMCU